MAHIKVIYPGALRTQATHLRSGTKITTDAPTDNNGKGESFSPTDLVCLALTSCMITTMGIVANRENIPLEGLSAEIIKIMASTPRKIQEIQINFSKPEELYLSEQQKELLIRTAHNCPVALSLSPDIKQTVQFDF